MKSITQEAHARQRMLKTFRKHRNATDISRWYHVSRKTIYKWEKLWDGTLESLRDRSRAPHHMPRKQSAEQMKIVERLSKRYDWKDPIRAYQEAIERYGYQYSYACFKRTARLVNCSGKPAQNRRKNKPYQRAEYPGQKVQIDVKFVPSECVTNGEKYYQYTAVDECTRWTFREMYAEHSTYSSYQFLKLLIEKAPFAIREVQTDNGSEFTNFLRDKCSDQRTLFEQELEENDIKYHRIKPATPRHNGKVERQHRIDQLRFYDNLRMYSLEDGRKQLATYQRKSNNILKECLRMRTPNQVLQSYLAVM